MATPPFRLTVPLRRRQKQLTYSCTSCHIAAHWWFIHKTYVCVCRLIYTGPYSRNKFNLPHVRLGVSVFFGVTLVYSRCLSAAGADRILYIGDSLSLIFTILLDNYSNVIANSLQPAVILYRQLLPIERLGLSSSPPLWEVTAECPLVHSLNSFTEESDDAKNSTHDGLSLDPAQ